MLSRFRRVFGFSQALSYAAGLAVVFVFVVSAVSGLKISVPTLSLLVLPFFFVVLLIVSTAFERLYATRGAQALSDGVLVLAFASLVSFFAALAGVWNDGSGLPILPLSQLGLALVSGGVLPFGDGPSVLVRFFPLASAVAVVLLSLGRSIPLRKVAAAAVLTYFSLFVLSQVPSIVALLSYGDSARGESAQELYRGLVRTQSAGYWSGNQTERFLAPLGEQAQTSILAVQGGVMVLLAAALLKVSSLLLLRGRGGVARRLLLTEAWFFPLSAVFGLLVGLSLRPDVPYVWSDVLAFGVAAFGLFAWMCWWRLREDVSNLVRDEERHPEYPLPAGRLSLSEAEWLSGSALVLSLLAAAVLGWPVLLGVLAATLAGLAPRGDVRSPLASTGFGLVSLLGLASAGLVVGARELALIPWMQSLVLSFAVLCALGLYLRHAAEEGESATRQAAIVTVGLVLACLLSRQPVMLIAGVASGLAAFALSRRDDLWTRFGFFTVFFVLLWQFICLVFLPSFIRHL